MNGWEWLVIGLGGAAGSVARFELGRLFRGTGYWPDLPWPILIINVAGSMLLGLIAGLMKDRSHALFLHAGVGFCGGFTTFSSFSLEVVEALQQGRFGVAFASVALNVVLTCVGCYAGLQIARVFAE